MSAQRGSVFKRKQQSTRLQSQDFTSDREFLPESMGEGQDKSSRDAQRSQLKKEMVANSQKGRRELKVLKTGVLSRGKNSGMSRKMKKLNKSKEE